MIYLREYILHNIPVQIRLSFDPVLKEPRKISWENTFHAGEGGGGYTSFSERGEQLSEKVQEGGLFKWKNVTLLKCTPRPLTCRKLSLRLSK